MPKFGLLIAHRTPLYRSHSAVPPCPICRRIASYVDVLDVRLLLSLLTFSAPRG